LLVLTDRHRAERAGHELPGLLAQLPPGRIAVVVREKDLPWEEREALVRACAAQAPELPLVLATGAVVVPEEAGLVAALGLAGVHTAGGFMLPAGAAAWRDLPPGSWRGKSCHDGAELRAATLAGASHVTLSPVHPTGSKPGYGPPLGLEALTTLAATVEPGGPLVFALGGIDATNAAPVLARPGVHGIAVLGAVMGAPDPARAVRDLVALIEG
jgi:thiamine-phosphate pyrophosphorylase